MSPEVLDETTQDQKETNGRGELLEWADLERVAREIEIGEQKTFRFHGRPPKGFTSVVSFRLSKELSGGFTILNNMDEEGTTVVIHHNDGSGTGKSPSKRTIHPSAA